MANSVPPLLAGLLDDAAMFPPAGAPLEEAVAAHRRHRLSWYAALVGPLLVPADEVGRLWSRLRAESVEPAEGAQPAGSAQPAAGQQAPGPLAVGLVGPLTVVAGALAAVTAPVQVVQVEAPVAKRREDPLPGVRDFLTVVGNLTGYAEVPLTAGLFAALDVLADARAAGRAVAPKFRTGGLAAELFPTPTDLAAVICACRDRKLPFKLTGALRRALRHIDPETGFLHHGFLNVLAATLAAADGADSGAVATILASTDAVFLTEAVRGRLDEQRPLWVGFGTASISEPLADLRRFSLVRPGAGPL